ncbi:hypothetical protein E2986_03786 [Frieseomelitta varia]|uniref:Nuclear protein MDM1 n=1 Tax=Frieseomelitta varia TaxID=561572 RepID=A0A833RZZ5_9HYME|nr:hypothetical protein E2986_03786 [Frieseomelitta varia]
MKCSNSLRERQAKFKKIAFASVESPPRTSVRKLNVKRADEEEKEKEPKDKEKEQSEKGSEPERHPRPTFLATTAPPYRPLHHVKPSTTATTTTTITTTTTTTITTATTTTINTTSTSVKPPVKHSVHTSVHHPPTSSAAAAARPDRVKDISRSHQGPNEAQAKTGRDQTAAAAAAAAVADPSKSSSDSRYASNQAATAVQPMTAEPQVNGDVTGGESSVASTPPSQTQSQPPVSATAASPWIDDEPVVKSPPEPTRVKSPEQMIMRSPEPVNWTVPLDTGKTFTVTQNVREEPLTRPHSEAKSWAPSSVPSAPQSAPPELAAQHKSQHSQHSGYKSPESESVSIGSFSGLNGHKDMDSERDSPLPSNVQASGTTAQGENKPLAHKLQESGGTEEESKEQQRSEPSIKPVPGTSLRCLEDPGFEYDRKKEGNGQPTTTSTITTPSSSTVSTGPQQGYRILEAESPQGATTDSGGGGGGGGGSSVGGTGGGSGGGYGTPVFGSTNVPGSAQRSAASEVLEKARNRFDKFWGKGSGSEN